MELVSSGLLENVNAMLTKLARKHGVWGGNRKNVAVHDALVIAGVL